MILDNTSLLLLAAPAAMLLVSLASTRRTGLRPLTVERLSIGAGAFGIYIAAIGAALLINHGPMQSTLVGSQALGFSVQLDPVTAGVSLMSALLAFQFVRLSRRLDGDSQQRLFLGRLTATAASVQFVVLTGNLAALVVAAMLSGLTLYGLLGNYHGRRGTLASPRQPQLDTPGGA
jgi:NAD(P)H-quinone oxidoreductase subunit 5